MPAPFWVPAKYVRVIGTVIRGDRAIVAQLMNDGPPFEVETAFCIKEADGTWAEGSSGNSTAGFLSGACTNVSAVS